MAANTVRLCVAYDGWANAKIFDAAAQVVQSDYVEQRDGPYPSLQATLLHMVNVYYRFLNWVDGTMGAMEAYGLHLDPADHPDVPTLRAKWDELHAQAQAWADRLNDERASVSLQMDLPDGRQLVFTTWQLAMHMTNHSTQHRAEAGLHLFELGHSPGDLDMLFYLMENPTTNG